jgi:RND family efflux transporter MFP subunit
LEAIERQQDTLVESALRTLVSEGLVAEPDRHSYSQTAPTISGLYEGAEGTYKVRVKRRSPTSLNYDLYSFDLERTGPSEISKTAPTKLGTYGLYITFPDGVAAYDDTSWYVQIPNTKSNLYLTNRNAYDEAKRQRSLALDEARASERDSSSGSSIAAAELEKALAAADEIRAQIGERILRAPFAGTVTAVDIDPGQALGANEQAVSLISSGRLGVSIDLPEIDSIKVQVGDKATVQLDAFGDEAHLPATVASVNRTETIVDGVPVYQAKVIFDKDDPRLSSGMTAEVTIMTNEKKDVVALPARAVRHRTDGAVFILVRSEDGKKETEREVALGLRSTDGYLEIMAGLSPGEVVVVPA